MTYIIVMLVIICKLDDILFTFFTISAPALHIKSQMVSFFSHTAI